MSIKPMEKFYVGLGMPKSDFCDWGCRKSDGWLQSAFKTNVEHTWDYTDSQTVGSQTVGSQAVGSQTVGSQTVGSQAVGSQTAGS